MVLRHRSAPPLWDAMEHAETMGVMRAWAIEALQPLRARAQHPGPAWPPCTSAGRAGRRVRCAARSTRGCSRSASATVSGGDSGATCASPSSHMPERRYQVSDTDPESGELLSESERVPTGMLFPVGHEHICELRRRFLALGGKEVGHKAVGAMQNRCSMVARAHSVFPSSTRWSGQRLRSLC